MNNFNPSTFYISVIDLFAILLPGSLASLGIYHMVPDPKLIDNFLNIGNQNTGFHTAFVLLFSSYLFGHIISQLSAYLDETVYDPLKEKVYDDHRRVERVKEIRKEKYGNALTPEYVNAFKWCMYKLGKEYPEAASEVDRYMVDSKFFRSLFIILLIMIFVFLFPSNYQPQIALICAPLALFSMIRYFKKRRKATETAYQYIIFLEELNTRKKTKKEKHPPKTL